MKHRSLDEDTFAAFYVDHGAEACFISFHLRGTCTVADGAKAPVQPCYARVDGGTFGNECDLPEGHP